VPQIFHGVDGEAVADGKDFDRSFHVVAPFL